MAVTVKNRISFWFGPREITNVHVPHSEVVSADTIKSAYNKVATSRYPTTYTPVDDPQMFSYPMPGRTPRKHIGDPAGINAWYEISPVLEFNGKYFELKEISS